MPSALGQTDKLNGMGITFPEAFTSMMVALTDLRECSIAFGLVILDAGTTSSFCLAFPTIIALTARKPMWHSTSCSVDPFQ